MALESRIWLMWIRWASTRSSAETVTECRQSKALTWLRTYSKSADTGTHWRASSLSNSLIIWFILAPLREIRSA